jgi:pimeloyl-ACP methyl ester carboxylesterase
MRTLCITTLGIFVLSACAVVSSGHLPPAQSGGLRDCSSLAQFEFQNTTIESVSAVASGTLKVAGKAVEAHCLVRGAMFNRTTPDGKSWAIRFEMRMPMLWNGRYFYQGNGGLDGVVVSALGGHGGGPVTHALFKGFAVISSDAGHSEQQTAQFGFDPQARLDYGYQAVGKLTPMAKALIKVAYGRGPDRSYIGGCSNGGRHAMVAAARFGDQYDGYLVGAPGFNISKASLANLWAAQQFSRLMTSGASLTVGTIKIADLNTGFTPKERALVSTKILEKCDALDGLVDGIVADTIACQSRFNVFRDLPTCSLSRDGTCLTEAQKEVLVQTHEGGKTSAGQTLYHPFWFEPGIAAPNWVSWKFESSQTRASASIGTVFRTPPALVGDTLSLSIDETFAQLSAVDSTYTESGISFLTPPDVNGLSIRMAEHKSRMIIYHGASDAIFSAAETATWYDAMRRRDANVDSRARYYVVPGMNHCNAGPATDQFDFLDPLIKWVEQGVAPEAVVASSRGKDNAGGANADLPPSWPASRTRLLCTYPKVARYESGYSELSGSFACR